MRKGQAHTEEAKAALRTARVNQVHPSLIAKGVTKEQIDAALKEEKNARVAAIARTSWTQTYFVSFSSMQGVQRRQTCSMERQGFNRQIGKGRCSYSRMARQHPGYERNAGTTCGIMV